MNTRTRMASVGVAFGLWSLPTFAQPDTTMTYSIVWEKSQIAPGETNKGKVVCTIEPGLGTVVPWTTPPNKGQPGTIMAFASSIFDIMNATNGLKGTPSYTIPNALNWSGIPGQSPDELGNIKGLNAGQFAKPLNPNPVLDNPIVICDFQWTAPQAVIEPFEVAYMITAASAKMYLDIGLPNGGWVGHNATHKVSAPAAGFTVIPAPGGAGALVAGVAWVFSAFARRRRTNRAASARRRRLDRADCR